MRKIREVLRLYHAAGTSVRAIARSVKASPSTVGEYIRRAEVHGLGWPLPASLDDGELEHRLFPAPAPSGTRRPLPHWSEVHRELHRRGRHDEAIRAWLRGTGGCREGEGRNDWRRHGGFRERWFNHATDE